MVTVGSRPDFSDERRGVIPQASRRTVLAGQTRWNRLALFFAGFAFSCAAVLALADFLFSKFGVAAPAWISPNAHDGLISGFVFLFLAAFLYLFPPACWRIMRPSVPRELRKFGIRLARNWRAITEFAFDDVIDLRGTAYYPGLLRVTVEDGAVNAVIGLPPVVVPGGVTAFLESGAGELVQRLGLAACDVKPIDPGKPAFVLVCTPYDKTGDSRAVQL